MEDVFPFSREVVERVIDDYELTDIRIRDSYSGRGMYGKECIGFVTPDINLVVQLLLALSAEPYESGVTRLMEVADNMLTDSMGRDMIVYFSNYHSFDGEDTDDEEAELQRVNLYGMGD